MWHYGDIIFMMVPTSWMTVSIKAEKIDKKLPGYVFLFSGQNIKTSVSVLASEWDFFFRWCGKAIWPTMFIYIAAQMLKTFYYSFTLLRRGPPLCNFNFVFSFTVSSYQEVLWLLFSWKTWKILSILVPISLMET